MSDRILVTPRSLTDQRPEAFALLAPLREHGYNVVFGPSGRLPEESELCELVDGCVGYLAGIESISAAVLERAGALRVIARNGTGVDNVDLVAAAQRGIAIERAPGANAQGVAELALALMFSGLRHLTASHEALREGRWVRFLGREAAGRTLGLVGFGEVGRRLARIASGIGMRVLYNDLTPVADGSGQVSAIFVPLVYLLGESDVVSLHLPALPGGRVLLGSGELELLRPGAVVVNTSRASLVDEAAMVGSLEDGTVSAYCTDVFSEEPPRAGPLRDHPRSVLSAHLGGFTQESVARASQLAVEGLLRVLEPEG